MRVDPEAVIDIPLTGAAKELKPVVFREGNMFCCLLGPNAQEGVFGCGNSPVRALEEWEENLKSYLANSKEDDPIVTYIKEVIHKEPKPRSPQMQAFYDQIRPVKRR